MGQIALIADIHANMPAFQSVLADIEKRKISRIMCLGDVIGKGPSNSETLDLCREKCEFILKGNWEEYVSYLAPRESAIWVQKQIGSERLEFIRGIKMYYEMWFSGKLIRMFHAKPDGFNRVFPNDPVESKKTLFFGENLTPCDIAIYADIHRPYMQTIEGRTIINIGSVGNPLDMPMASYVVLTGDIDSKKKGSFSVEIVRLEYDIEKAVQDAKDKEGMPEREHYIGEITACKYVRKKLN